jgi:phosphatidylglycerol---prolipoprotein diacylglyceryl transferase
MQQVLFRIPLNTAWFPEWYPLWAVVATLICLAVIAAWLVTRLAFPKEPGNWSLSSGMLWVGSGVLGGLVSRVLLGGLQIKDGVPIYGFGMMLFLAFLLCTWVAGRRAESEGIRWDTIQDLAIWLFLGGLLGARVTYLLQKDPWPSTFMDFLMSLPRIWEGGIILYGSVLGAMASYALGYWLVFRKEGIPTLKLADVIAPSMALGLCLGRIGCFLNGCCYGQVACADCAVYPVHFPLSAPARYSLVDEGYQTCAGFTFDVEQDGNGVKVGKVEPGSAAANAGLASGDIIERADGHPMPTTELLSDYLANFSHWPPGKTDLTLEIHGQSRPLTFTPRTLGLHPTQLYESVSMLLLFLFLTAVYPFRRHEGQVTALLMICYGLHRFFNELLRNDPRPVGFERYASVILIAGGVLLALMLWRTKGTKKAPLAT